MKIKLSISLMGFALAASSVSYAADAASTLVARKDFPAKDINELLSYLPGV